MTSEAACSAVCDDECGVGSGYEYSEEDCLAGDTLLYLCDEDKHVAARDVMLGDKIGSVVETAAEEEGRDHRRICSEVYHIYHHAPRNNNEKYTAIAIEIGGSNDGELSTLIQVSPNHLVYTGDSFKNRRPVRAKTVVAGDKLVVSSGGGGCKVVRSVNSVEVDDLVNILTYEPTLEVNGDIVVSAYSYHETAYHYLIALPLQIWYNLLGNLVPNLLLYSIDWEDTFDNLKPWAHAIMDSF